MSQWEILPDGLVVGSVLVESLEGSFLNGSEGVSVLDGSL
jgi:hypothetical protein